MIRQVLARRVQVSKSLATCKPQLLLYGSQRTTAASGGVLDYWISSLRFAQARRCQIKLSTSCSILHLGKNYSMCAPQATQPGGIIEVPLAQTGEGIADCELLSWLVNEGDEVEEFQPLCSVQSDKATIQITSRYKGKVSRLNFLPGDIINVGESLLELISGSVAHSSSEDGVQSKDERLEESDSSAQHESDGHVEASSSRVLAPPAVRQLARTHGIKLETISGSGKGGRVVKEDVLKLAEDKEGLNEEMMVISNIAPKEEITKSVGEEKQGKMNVETSVCLPVNEEDTTIHIRGYQRAMVKAMTAAVAIPHIYLVEELKVDALINLRRNLQESYSEQGIKLTYLPFMIKALSVALSKYPLMNSIFNEAALSVSCKGAHNVGVAIATPRGLAVPNIKNVQRLSVIEIAMELSRLTQLATANQLTTEDISGGTISVSNFGSIGGKMGYPLLNLPEVAIGALGRIHKAPCFAEDGNVCSGVIHECHMGGRSSSAGWCNTG